MAPNTLQAEARKRRVANPPQNDILPYLETAIPNFHVAHPCRDFALPARRLIMGVRLSMSLEQAILEAVRALPVEQQQEVLEHAAKLRDAAGAKSPFKSVKGLWADLGVSLSPEEIEENQRDM